jgi:sec-independent protein translocase protein TatB
MFDLFSWSHILILLTVALIVVGPKDLPRLMNIAGRWAGKARNMANEFKKSFDDMARQSELDELRAEVEKLRSTDPIADLTSDIERTLNPVDTEAAEARAAAAEAPAPRSGEYQISEAPEHQIDPSSPDAQVSDVQVPDAQAPEVASPEVPDPHPQAAQS